MNKWSLWHFYSVFDITAKKLTVEGQCDKKIIWWQLINSADKLVFQELSQANESFNNIVASKAQKTSNKKDDILNMAKMIKSLYL